jgi:hypothetical protein
MDEGRKVWRKKLPDGYFKTSHQGVEGVLVGAVNEHRQTAGTDDLFRAFMIAGEVYPGFIVGAAYKTFNFLVKHSHPPAS